MALEIRIPSTLADARQVYEDCRDIRKIDTFLRWFFPDIFDVGINGVKGLQTWQWRAIMELMNEEVRFFEIIATRGVGKSLAFQFLQLYLAVYIDAFQGLWLAPEQEQANKPYRVHVEGIAWESERFRYFFPRGKDSMKKTPFPTLYLRAPWLENVPDSLIEWRHIGKPPLIPNHLRGDERDYIHVDEAQMVEEYQITRVIRPMMRGRGIGGRERMRKMTLSGTGPEEPDMWMERIWKRANDANHPEYNPLRYRAARVLDDEAEIYTEEEKEEQFEGLTQDELRTERAVDFPRVSGRDFDYQTMRYVWNDNLMSMVQSKVLRGESGYDLIEKDFGVILYEEPWEPAGEYVMGTDPGSGNAPGRNSAGFMVFRIMPSRLRLVCLSWVSGFGHYDAWETELSRLFQKYQPLRTAMDTTGTQKGMGELIYMYRDIPIMQVNFATEKDRLLNYTRRACQEGILEMPRLAGLETQLLKYDRDQDKKIAQDLVMTLAVVVKAMHTEINDRLGSQERHKRIQAIDEDQRENLHVNCNDVIMKGMIDTMLKEGVSYHQIRKLIADIPDDLPESVEFTPVSKRPSDWRWQQRRNLRR